METRNITIRVSKTVLEKIERLRGRKTATRFCQDLVIDQIQGRQSDIEDQATEFLSAIKKLEDFDPGKTEQLLLSLLQKFEEQSKQNGDTTLQHTLIFTAALASKTAGLSRLVEQLEPELYRRIVQGK